MSKVKLEEEGLKEPKCGPLPSQFSSEEEEASRFQLQQYEYIKHNLDYQIYSDFVKVVQRD
jgi:hypothetical protein